MIGRFFLAVLVVVGLAVGGPPVAGQTTPQGTAGGASIVGTWTLDSIEQPNRPPGQRTALRGLLIFDNAGHVFESVSRPGSGFSSFQGFWGTYRVDPARRTLTLVPSGAVSPNLMGRELARTFALENDRLTITPAPGEPHLAGLTGWVWERVPLVDNLSPQYRSVIGFWQHVVEKRINLTTGASNDTRRAPSIIVYSPSGYVGVHFPPLNRQKFAGEEPTEAEARSALMGYVGYLGALGVYPNMVFHHILASVGSTQGTLKRPLEMSGNEVTIKFPVTRNQQGQESTTWVILRRLSGERDMLGDQGKR